MFQFKFKMNKIIFFLYFDILLKEISGEKFLDHPTLQTSLFFSYFNISGGNFTFQSPSRFF